MARLFTPTRLLIAGVLLLAVAGFVYLKPSNEYLFLPDRARAVAPYVTIKGERNDGDGGGIYYVAVQVERASLLEKLFPGLREGSTLHPASDVVAPGETEKQHQRVELHEMAESQEVAAAVALRALGRNVVVKSPGTVILAVQPAGPSAGKITPGDIVVRVDGRPAPFENDLRRLIRRHKPGDAVVLTVRHDDKVKHITVKTIADPDLPTRPLIGVQTSCATQAFTRVSLPVPVRIDLGQVGGPSAGLAFALDIAEELGRDVDRGYRVAATGALCLDGTVIPIGGVKQKTIGAKQAGADVFIVPAGDNAAEARRYAGTMRVLPVHSFRQALRELATLPRKR